MTRGLVRRIARAAVVVVVAGAFLPLGGCAVSLFSHDLGDGVDSDKLDELEHRMDVIERSLPPR